MFGLRQSLTLQSNGLLRENGRLAIGVEDQIAPAELLDVLNNLHNDSQVSRALRFNMMREEWKELRAEVKEMRHRLDEMPDGQTLNRLADDVQDLGRRLGRLESQVNSWDE